jgi:CubicO group peptidase (beta-lactamase class C family)
MRNFGEARWIGRPGWAIYVRSRAEADSRTFSDRRAVMPHPTSKFAGPRRAATRRSILAGAGGLALGAASPALAATGDYWPAASGWAAVAPAQAGLDAARLSAALDAAMADRSADLLVLRGGRIVAERYAAGAGVTRTQEIASAAKSMVSVLVGVCIDQGRIRGVEQSASDFIPQWKGTPKEAITLRHLLTMTSGLDFRDLKVRGVAGDQFAINAAAPQIAPPGTQWAYATPIFHLLYHVVARAAGEPFEAFAGRNLLEPLGMKDTTWVTNVGQGANGPVTNYYSARCSARDLARFGLFALRGGRWEARQVVSEAYLRQATAPSQDLNPAYGFLWWENARPGHGALPGEPIGYRFEGSPHDVFAALGAGGQVVLVVPSLDIVVVRQGENPSPRMIPTLLAEACASAGWRA